MSEVNVFRPAELDRGKWRQLQGVALEACEATFPDGYDPEAYVDWNDPDRFRESHLDPTNSEVGRRFNFNQKYRNLHVAVATRGSDVIGWGYSQSNVSGGGSPNGPQNDSAKARAQRLYKQASIISPLAKSGSPLDIFSNRNYFQLREIYVLPECQGNDLAHKIGAELLKVALPWQPVATYLYPDIAKENHSEESMLPLERLHWLGFTATDEVMKNVDWASEPVRQVRLQAPRAAIVRQRLANWLSE